MQVSERFMSKEDRIENRNLQISLRELWGQNSCVPYFTEDEIREAFKNMLPKRAPVPDNISPPLLKNLGPNAIKLLHIFNLSLMTENPLDRWMSPSTLGIQSRLPSSRPMDIIPHWNCRNGTYYVNDGSPTLTDFFCISYMFFSVLFLTALYCILKVFFFKSQCFIFCFQPTPKARFNGQWGGD